MFLLAGPLFVKNSVVIPVKGSFPFLPGVAFGCRIDNQGTDRTGRLVARYLPVKPVLFAFITDKFHGVTPGRFATSYRGGIVLLGRHQGVTDLDGVVLVGSNAAVQNLIFSVLD